MEINFFTDNEWEALAISLAEARGEKGFTEKEFSDLLSACNWATLQWHGINAAIKGAALIDIDADGLIFKAKN